MASETPALPAFGAARARWSRATSRERLLLAGLGLAALAYLPFAAQGWAQVRATQATDNAARLQALTAADDGTRLRGVEARVTGLEARVRAWSPTAPSFPVARVLVEQEVALAAAGAGMTSLDVHAAETPDQIGPARFVRVELGSSFTWSSLAVLMRRLAAVRPGYVVDRASAEGEGEQARLRLVLLAPFSPPDRA